MNALDILLLLPLLYGAWIGFRKGLIIELATLLAFALGIWGAIHFSDWTAGLLADAGVESEYMSLIAFTITFLLIGAGVFFGGKALEKVINIAALKPLNKMGGALFGTAKFLMVCSVALIIVESYDRQSAFLPSDLKEGSLLYTPVKETSLTLIPAIERSDAYKWNGLQPLPTRNEQPVGMGTNWSFTE